MERPIRVLIADDQPVVVKTLCMMLKSAEDLEVVGVAVDGDEAVELSSAVHPDVILIDYSMPHMSGAEATRRIIDRERQATVLGLSAYASERADEMRLAGAATCLDKTDELNEVVAAIRIAGTLPPPSCFAPRH